MLPSPRFRLRKWYADCVTPEGAVFVGYLARLRWGVARLSYAATLELDPSGRLTQRQGLRSGTLDASDGVRIELPSLTTSGTWAGGSGTAPYRVAATPAGEVTWQALTLAARAEVRCGATTYRGTGYAEVVTLTLPPWRLPFDELIWGRFVADDASLGTAWIDTAGPDGVRSSTFAEGTAGPDARPRLVGTDVTMRSGLVRETLFGRWAGAGRLLPGGVRNLAEHKALSRGVVATAAGDVPGWVVHERVTWR